MKKLLGLAFLTAVLLSGCGEVQISINKDQEVEAETGSAKKEKVDLINDESESEKMKEADKQKAILQFINEDIYKVAEYEVVAFQSLASVSGVNYTDDQTVYRELTTITIPAYKKALNEAQGIEAGIPELEEMATRVVTATKTFYDSLILEKKAIEDQDEGLISESNAKMEEYYKLVDAYHSDMKLLAEEYNVTYDLNEPKQNVEEL
ncbi:hypothetical protein B0G93_10761 [Bacillus sp. V-88]|nr:hypothetical protein B1B00_09565 [Bacillus sp. DSM 27956]PRX76778.1 hypothetical protein B0G93_10761 [Bacillus sp. V-88]SLK21955.1 hypothetical protein SAMN06295884_10761 [Bacillus sp. V-88]